MKEVWRSTLNPDYTIQVQHWRDGLYECDWLHKDELTGEGFLCTLKALENHFWREA